MPGASRLTGLAGFVAALVLVVSGNSTAQMPSGLPAPGPAPGSPPSVEPGAPSAVPTPPTAPQALPPAGSGGGGFPGQPGGPTASPVFLSGTQAVGIPAPQRFSFKIDPKTPVKDLLPTPPTVKPVSGPILTDDLTKIPEANFQARPEKAATTSKLMEETAHQLAKMNHLNARKPDAFMTALLESRTDLAGLPFAMGDDCRTAGERSKQFTIAVNTVRQALGGDRVVFVSDAIGGSTGGAPFSGGRSGPLPAPQPNTPQPVNSPFWTQYPTLCDQQDALRIRPDKEVREHVTVARIAALMQMLAPESADLRLGLVKYLTAIPHAEATRALAKLAIFSAEEDVRAAAIEALQVRREKDYTDILVKGLRYPWPAVAQHSADAIARMGRTDLIPELIGVLAASDPRMPTTKVEGGKSIAVVREMVRVNHHRNCMMCHAPGNPDTVSANALTAEVPIPGQPLPSPSQGYQSASPSPDLMIRVDVTYLRQDFSARLPVADAQPWPEMQRFDFFVRERKLTSAEATDYQQKLTPKEAGVLSPYHKAAVAALRELTGKDTAPTAEAWRKLLGTKSRVE